MRLERFDRMNPERFDRRRLRFRPVASRESKFEIEEISVDPEAPPIPVGTHHARILDRVATEVRAARERGAPVAICHGAHLIKNGLGALLIRFLEEGWITHVATNGAGSIHDWEFAYLGRSCEDVRAYVSEGQFGLWDETGGLIAAAILTGAPDGLGYGGAVGRFAAEGSLRVPDAQELRARLAAVLARESEAGEECGPLVDLLEVVEQGALAPGASEHPHRSAHRSVQALAWRLGVPYTVHPGIGQDIIYSHPAFHGGAIGRASVRDFLAYAATVRRILEERGVYLSVGSSVMSPMIFEKSVSMARNLAYQRDLPFQDGDAKRLDDFYVLVNDLAESTWDWSQGEPPPSDPAYYVRFCKSFSRMGGRLDYLGLDNRAFLTQLWSRLRG